MQPSVPLISMAPLTEGHGDLVKTAKNLRQACRNVGFFYITDHGISTELQKKLEVQSRAFFEMDAQKKMKIRMARGGKAWRGYFPVGNELTSGKPDLKEGLYFGAELDGQHPKVKKNLPMHGANLFPEEMPEFKTTVLEYIEQLTRLGHQLMKALALSLELPDNYFFQKYTSDPLTLFRIFHYPPSSSQPDAEWGVGEHTDYGLLTILKQDNVGGLQVKTPNGWVNAPYLPNTFVCNIGDMLDKMTNGWYKSTPHRVKNVSNQSRFSFPFFFDPNFEATVEPIDLKHLKIEAVSHTDRWDEQNLHDFSGTYGEYVLSKVAKVFPQLLDSQSNDR